MSGSNPSAAATRRDFLVGGAALAVAAAALPTQGPAASAIEPIGRAAAKFKFSLAAYSYRTLLQGANKSLSLDDFVDDCARFQLEGTELTSYYFPPDVDDTFLRQLSRRCFRQGLDISGTAIGNDFGFAPGPQRDEQIRLTRQWIQRAAVLGAPVIRIFAGHTHDGQTDAQAYAAMVTAIEECCQYAGEHGVHLALENHGGPTASADGLLQFVRDVQSPWFGVNLDTGNFRSDDVYADIERVAPFALNVQVKVVVAGPGGGTQPTDYARLAKILRAANYRGYIVLEYEEDADPRRECPHHLQQMRAAFQAS
jgi:sugar phosphate isomerase/epimerase